jgi:hypothetical protein
MRKKITMSMPRHARDEERGQALEAVSRALPFARFTIWILIQIWDRLHRYR